MSRRGKQLDLSLPVSNSLQRVLAAEKSGELEELIEVMDAAIQRHRCTPFAALGHIEREAKAHGKPLSEDTMLLLNVVAVQVDQRMRGTR